MERLVRICLFFELAGGFRNTEKEFTMRILGVDEATFEKVDQATKRVVDTLVGRILQEVREVG